MGQLVVSRGLGTDEQVAEALGDLLPTEETPLNAGHGFVTLQEAALQHAASGRTTFEEVLRVTQVDAPEPV
jgi:type II secretory ATPase GspE/PulE/Tfp pilus assembly ATPase PilB-like protein